MEAKYNQSRFHFRVRTVLSESNKMSFRSRHIAVFASLAATSAAIILSLLLQSKPEEANVDQTSLTADLAGAFQNLPLHFEPNLGQGRKGTEFLSQGRNYQLDLSKDGANISLAKQTDEGSGSAAYVPPEAKDDLQLQYALELLRGQKTDPSFPANPEKAELKK